MRYKDVRQRTINEIFNEIKILKMYAWEHHFEERAVKMRQDEVIVTVTENLVTAYCRK